MLYRQFFSDISTGSLAAGASSPPPAPVPPPPSRPATASESFNDREDLAKARVEIAEKQRYIDELEGTVRNLQKDLAAEVEQTATLKVQKDQFQTLASDAVMRLCWFFSRSL